MTDLLQVKDLRVDFKTQAGTVRALDGISFRVRAGSTVALVGESGSGKSVAAQTIMGILPRTAHIASGEILLSDPELKNTAGVELNHDGAVDLTRIDPNRETYRQIRGNRISIVFQEPMTSLSPLHTIGDQISESLCIHRETDQPTARELTIEMLRLVGFPDPARAFDTYPFELSGGLRQRAMISLALICHPGLLIADEPSTALDVTIQAQILKLIMDLQSELGMAILMITHDLGVVANIAEEIVVVYHGKIMESGTLDDIFSNPKHPYLKGLLNAVPHFDMKLGERLVPLREIKHTTGHLLVKKSETSVASDKPLLDVQHINKSFMTRSARGAFGLGAAQSVRAVDDVSFAIQRGECLGLVGESGCGKTTLSKIIMREMSGDSGSVIFNDGKTAVDLTALNEKQLIPLRQHIQYVFQDPFGSLNPRMTVFDILSEPLVIHNIGDSAYRREMVSELMTLVGLNARHLNRYPHSFSGGQRQRIGIARSLALKPDLLLLDEPVSALDVSIQAQILNLLKDLQKELSLTYLFVSHNLAVVDYMADRIAVMCAGRIVEIAPREVLFRNPTHPYTRALVAAVPYPDPERRLDFTALMEGRASIPSAWPVPFGDQGDEPLNLIDLGEDHWVRASSMPKPVEAV